MTFLKLLWNCIRSIWDYILFFEIRLSPRPLIYATLLILFPIVAISVSVIGPRSWGAYSYLSVPLALLGYIIKLALGYWSPGKSQYYFFQAADDIFEKIRKSQPHEDDVARGYRAEKPPIGVYGAVHLSKKFNVECITFNDWDAPIIEGEKVPHYDEVVDQLRNMRLPFRQMGLKTVLRKLFDGKPLINESKIAVSCDFHVGMLELKVFKSSYFATWCGADLAHLDIVEVTNGHRRIYSLAADRVPFIRDGSKLILKPLSVVSERVSTQLGINFIGVTSDRILRIAIQGKKTMHGQEKRVPLATGSMDWQDRNNSKTFKKLGEVAALRELREEWGNNKKLSRSKPLQITKFLPVGVFRVPDRSGKPEFAALGQLNWSNAELRADKSEVEDWEDQDIPHRARTQYPVENFEKFCSAIRQLLKLHGGIQDTTPLFGVLLCIQDLIDANPEKIKETLGYP